MAAALDSDYSDYSFSASNSSSTSSNASNGSSQANNPTLLRVENREGDWKAYLQQCANAYGNKNLIGMYGSVTAYKRACALAYLGKRAQFHGGVCSKTHPSILTPKFIADLEADNKSKRYGRYPWMERLLNLLAEIERIQDEISSPDPKIISLVSSPK